VRRPKLLLLQIDGLSARRLERALDDGTMPNLKRWLDSGGARLRRISSATEPSTPVFTAGMMYGRHADVPGFAWYDRALGRTVRMDLPEDVQALERDLRAEGPPLLEGGTSYGTIWPGGTDDAFFNVASYQLTPPRSLARALARGARAVAGGAGPAARILSRMALELAVGSWDFLKWCRRVGTTRFEWRFLYMRIFVSVVMRDAATQLALLDLERGVPRIFIDYLGYDEYAHRRGPDSELALYNLRGIDHSIGQLQRAAARAPDLGYELFVLSDHGQSATTPFEWICGRDLAAFVLEHVASAAVWPVESDAVKKLVALRELEIWVRTLSRPLRPPFSAYARWLRRRLQPRLGGAFDGVEVVTGGTIAHLYLGGRGRLPIDEIRRKHPALLDALIGCRAIGLVVADGRRGPVVFYRGREHPLADERTLALLPPFRAIGCALLRRHLEQAARGPRHGDLILYGAFAPAGEVAFDFEFGSHGGVGPEELAQFVIHPATVDFPLEGAVAAEAFYRYFARRYGAGRDDNLSAADAA
jgi:hypothetical protein